MDDIIHVVLYHRGKFVNVDTLDYDGANVRWPIDPYTWGYFKIIGKLKEMKYNEVDQMWYLSGPDFVGDNLKLLTDDNGAMEMLDIAREEGCVFLYILHPLPLRPVVDEDVEKDVSQEDGGQRIPKLKCIVDVPIQAMQEAKTFKSRHPFFKVIVRANKKEDYRPRVPVAFMRQHFAEKHIMILRYANKSWEVHLTGKVQTKLSKGWFRFAKESNLQVGDVCIFELIDKVGPLFDVHICKK